MMLRKTRRRRASASWIDWPGMEAPLDDEVWSLRRMRPPWTCEAALRVAAPTASEVVPSRESPKNGRDTGIVHWSVIGVAMIGPLTGVSDGGGNVETGGWRPSSGSPVIG